MLKRMILALLLMCAMSSCFVARLEVREGPKLGIQEEDYNDYYFWGLKPHRQVDTHEMAKGAPNYRIEKKFDLFDCFWTIFTLGIYSRTSVIVIR
jgi:hypothetical protein